jgi:hypothetical protein
MGCSGASSPGQALAWQLLICQPGKEGVWLKIFFVSDIHGSIRCFRKLVNAGKF